MKPSSLEPSRWALLVLSFCLFLTSLPVFWLGPLGDDWGTLHPFPEVFTSNDQALATFWRPVHDGFVSLGKTISFESYVVLLHCTTLLGHAGSALLLLRLLKGCVAPWASVATAWLFFVFPGTNAAAWSLDSFTQTWSTALGLAAVLLALHQRARLAWPFVALAAAVTKESGVGWAAAVPLLATWLQTGTSPPLRPRRAVVEGTVTLLAYLVLRVVATGRFPLGASVGRYTLQFDPLRWLSHLVQLAGVSLTSFDTVAWFAPHGSVVWAVLSLTGGLPIAWLVVARRRPISTVWPALVAFLALAVPHLGLQHVSEMYAHPLAAVAFLFAGRSLLERSTEATSGTRAVTLRCGFRTNIPCWMLAAFVASTLATSAHKFVTMYASSLGSRAVADHLATYEGQAPAILCSALPRAPTPGYSVFSLAPGPASLWGLSITAHHDWRYPTTFLTKPTLAHCEHTNADWIVDFSDAQRPVVVRRPARRTPPPP